MTEQRYAEALQQEATLTEIKEQITSEANGLAAATEARNAAAARCKVLAVRAYAEGMPEAHIAVEMRVNRRTIRRWLGKPERSPRDS